MGELRRAAEETLRTEVELQGAGRTDAGVHALAQVAHMRADVKTPRHPEAILRDINEALPADIAVVELEPVSARFHARHDALTRTYAYQISTRKTAFAKRFVWWIKDKLDVELMTEAAGMLTGRHDFVCFRAQDPSKPDDSTIVKVESAAIELRGDLVVFRIEASHFLWRMVRRLAGVLVRLGRSEITMDDFRQLLEGRSEPRLDVAAWTAPASGLFLEDVTYPERPRKTHKKRPNSRRS
jgi:tRNA pseudouridine38-40 synthase